MKFCAVEYDWWFSGMALSAKIEFVDKIQNCVNW